MSGYDEKTDADWNNRAKKTIALDFDGVLHQYEGWKDGTIYGPPVEGAIEAINQLKKDFQLIIFTCRTPIRDVADWFREKFGFNIHVTNSKPHADLYIDDRGCRFNGDWDHMMDLVTIYAAGGFKTWNNYKPRTAEERAAWS